jgi:hypothetical protein
MKQFLNFLCPFFSRGGRRWLATLLGLGLFLAAVSCQKAPPPAEDDPPEGEDGGVVNLPDIFRDVTDRSGVKFTYRNGQEFVDEKGNKRSHYAILESLGGGVALIDYDGDGRLDIFVTGGGHYAGKGHKRIEGYPNRLYRNLGKGKFQDVTKQVGLDRVLFYSHGAAVGDYDRDGWPDLLVTGYGRVALYHNEPVDPDDPSRGRRFRDVTREVGLLDKKHFWATSAAFADLDGDGYPDLYVCQYVNWSWKNNPRCGGYHSEASVDVCPPKSFDAVPHALYHNVPGPDGCRRFVDVSKEAGIRVQRKDGDYGKGLGVVIVDVNGDGRPDIYVANDTTDNFLYLNRSRPGKLSFVERGMALGVARDGGGIPNGSMGVDAGDYDGSGRASLWVTNYEGELHGLYQNVPRGRGQYFRFATEVAGVAAIGQRYVGFGTGFVDATNHGWEDLVISNGHVIRHPRPPITVRQQPVLLQNQGGGRFRNITAAGGAYFRSDHLGRGLAVGDLDNDGWPDLVISHLNEPVRVLRNVARKDYPTHHWLGVKLVGEGHRDVVGARVTLEAGGRRLTRFAKGGGSYLSSGDRRLLFGLGEIARVGKLTVTWPSGSPRQQTWKGLRVDRYHRLVQGRN